MRGRLVCYPATAPALEPMRRSLGNNYPPCGVAEPWAWCVKCHLIPAGETGLPSPRTIA